MSNSSNIVYASGLPTDAHGETNFVYLSTSNTLNVNFVQINIFIFTVQKIPEIDKDKIGFSAPQRKLLNISTVANDKFNLDEIGIVPKKSLALKAIIKVEFRIKSDREKCSEIDYAKFTSVFIGRFKNQYIANSQKIIFNFDGLRFTVAIESFDSISEQTDIINSHCHESNSYTQLTENTKLVFKFEEGVNVDNIPSELMDSEMAHNKNLININPYHLEKLGIGGLSEEFTTLFRRAFISRLLPPSFMKKLNITHVKGVLLYGPPGTGKTLIARKIGEMLNCKPPKIVNGPEIFNKYVGEAEKNIRALFADAETEQLAKGDKSQLHLIIFDEFDSLAKKRGSGNDGTSVNDNVVNQLLSKIDGVNALNNVLLIGLTNRKDMIDEAILRAGRFEVHIEISLPNEHGRIEIFNIHTQSLRDNKMLSPNVNIPILAQKSKNYSGAEIAGLVNSAQSYAIQKRTDPKNPSHLVDIDKICIEHEDFEKALFEVKPLFGQTNELFDKLENNTIIKYGDQWINFEFDVNTKIVNFKKNTSLTTYRMLFFGNAGCGKTTISSYFANKVNYPYVKIISPTSLVGYGEMQKINIIKKIFSDAYKSEESIIIIDDIERLIEFSEYGGRYTNSILQTLLVLINENTKKGSKLLIITTCKNINIMENLEVKDQFDCNIEIENVSLESAQIISQYYGINKIVTDILPIKKLISWLLI